MAFLFVSNSEVQYKFALAALMRLDCDENAGMTPAELNERAFRMLRLAADDFYPAKQLLSACCSEGLLKTHTFAEATCMPPLSMRQLVRKARLEP